MADTKAHIQWIKDSFRHFRGAEYTVSNQLNRKGGGIDCEVILGSLSQMASALGTIREHIANAHHNPKLAYDPDELRGFYDDLKIAETVYDRLKGKFRNQCVKVN